MVWSTFLAAIFLLSAFTGTAIPHDTRPAASYLVASCEGFAPVNVTCTLSGSWLRGGLLSVNLRSLSTLAGRYQYTLAAPNSVSEQATCFSVWLAAEDWVTACSGDRWGQPCWTCPQPYTASVNITGAGSWRFEVYAADFVQAQPS